MIISSKELVVNLDADIITLTVSNIGNIARQNIMKEIIIQVEEINLQQI